MVETCEKNDLVHGEWIKWLENIDMDRYQAARFIKVFDNLGESNVRTCAHLGLESCMKLPQYLKRLDPLQNPVNR